MKNYIEITLLGIDVDVTEDMLEKMAKQINSKKVSTIYLAEKTTKKMVKDFDLHGAFIKNGKLIVRISKRSK